jgi:hypothetical protein
MDPRGRKWWGTGEDFIMRFYVSPNSPIIIRIMKLRRMKYARYVAHMGEMKHACIILARKPGGKRPLKKT